MYVKRLEGRVSGEVVCVWLEGAASGSCGELH